MSRRKPRPRRRRARSDVELAAKRCAALYPSMLDEWPEESLALAEEILDEVAIIQRGWDERTLWLRSRGVTYVPRGVPGRKLLERVEDDAFHNIPRFARVFPVDRALFDFSYWFQQDQDASLPPDEYAAEVELALRPVRGLYVPIRYGPDDGPAPSSDAMPLGPAHAWQDESDWVFTTHKMDSPLNADRVQRFNEGGDLVLRIDGHYGPRFVRGAKPAPRLPPDD